MFMRRHAPIQIICLGILLLVLAGPVLAQENISRMVKSIVPGVVTVITGNSQGKQTSLGSGFFCNPEGHVITNYHVIKGASRISVKAQDGQTYPVKAVLAEDRSWDVALLAVDIPPARVRPLRITSVLPELGDRIFVVGSPLGLEQTLSDGLVSGVRPLKGGNAIIQISAPISKGSSGGPVVNMKGEVVGIATFMIGGGQNLNFAIPGARLLALKPGSGRYVQDSGPLPASPSGAGRTDNYKKRADDYFKTGNYDQAIANYQRALQANPADAELYYGRGTAYALKGQLDLALNDLNRCLEINPRNAQAYNNRGILYARKNQYGRALQDYEQALRLSPRYAHAYYNKGYALEKLGRTREAVEAYKSFLRYASAQNSKQIDRARERLRALGAH